ncbi:MAG: SAF domain-containing protein [Chloroflexi bacterium]|nr:SAF domain-containing protein [Chloroflexota bacterium]MBU1747805.1 SAF domain-containing protein [Chloroflexota bacterium]MBU1878110.1 SAF domain-containing protein [Chloroflexota bacterium]
MRRALLVITLIATVLAVGVGWYGTRQYESLVVTRPFVVARVAIAPYTVITADMLTTQELPAVLAQEQPVYVAPAEVVGQLATTAIATGTLIYQAQAVSAADWRYPADPRAEVLALGLPPAQALAGQVQPGQRVNVYNAAALLVERAPVRGVYPARTSAGRGSQVILLLEVRPAEARRLVQCLAESGEDLWVSLAPLVASPAPATTWPAERGRIVTGGM